MVFPNWHLESFNNFDYRQHFPICGCWYYLEAKKTYLPLVQTKTHIVVLSTASHTTLEQTFTNSSITEAISRCTYEFPLYDGVSVTSFTCSIGTKKLFGVVNERTKATRKFEEAVGKGETASLLEQDLQASDVFRTVLGNIPPGETIHVRVTYVGELKQDAEVGGLRLTIPSIIAPRYGSSTLQSPQGHAGVTTQARDMSVIVDVDLAEGSPLQAIESPSHPIGVSIGSISTSPHAEPTLTKGSASLSLQESTLDKDFVLLIKAKDIDVPRAILERHPTVEGHWALMTTLVPRFSLPLIQPEIVFIADRSGSMTANMAMLKQAMAVFLRSIPPGVKFNICSFGNRCDFLWERSQPYMKGSLERALNHVESFQANYGGTETLRALQATVGQRYHDLPLDIVLLTDGDIWDQETALKWLGAEVKKSSGQIRVFPLGIGNGVSHALIEGIARAGNGFAQAVQAGERMEKKVVRMLKGALSPHISDYTLEVVFKEDDFEMVENLAEDLSIRERPAAEKDSSTNAAQVQVPPQPTISLFDSSVDPFTAPKDSLSSGPDLPEIPVPNPLQAPSVIPALYPFVRTTVYLLLASSTLQRSPEAVILRASSKHGPLELRIPITELEECGTTVHCLAARKAVQDLEEGRGWLQEATDKTGSLLSTTLPGKFPDLVQREAVRLGETYQVVNRWCSFIAVEADTEEDAKNPKAIGRENLLEESPPTYSPMRPQHGVDEGNSGNWLRKSSPKTFAKSALPVCPPMQPGGFNFKEALRPPAPAPSRARLSEFSTADVSAEKSKASHLQNPTFGGQMSAGLFGSSMSPLQQAAGGPQGSLFGGPAPAGGVFGSSGSGKSSLFGGGGLFGIPPPSSRSAVRGSVDEGNTVFLQTRQPGFTPGLANAGFTAPSDMPMTDANRVLHIIALQEFDGHWTASTDIASLLEVDRATVMGQEDVNITSMVMCFLEQRMGGERDVWEMVVEKARAWLQSNGLNVAELRAAALAALKLGA